MNYQLPIKQVTYKIKHRKKTDVSFFFFLSHLTVSRALSTSLLRSFNFAPPHRSWPIFTSSSYKSQVTILHTFSLNLSSRFGFLNDGFNYWFISIECVSRIGFFFIPSPFSLNISSRFWAYLIIYYYFFWEQ